MKNGETRQEQLRRDLIKYCPKSWKLNIPNIDYNLRLEDLIPAISGAIGKIALVAAFAVAWANGLGINNSEFITENVRLEIVIGSIFTIVFCALLNPYAAPPGTLAPLIPIVPMMTASGMHPLPLGLLIGVIGFAASIFRFFDKVALINGPGAKGGIILLFGFLGISSSLTNLKKWSDVNNANILLVALIIAGLLIFLLLNKYKARWFVIPLCAVSALTLSAVFGIVPEIRTPVSLPLINPALWWNEKWGIGWGMGIENFIKAMPFALLAVTMWPTDALAIKTLLEANYPEEAKNSIFNMNATFLIASIRNIVGVFLGGGQTAAIWRSFMIPLGTVKRPIGGSALLLGLLGILFGISGLPLDIAVFPPLIWLVLIFGVYIPLMEVGMNTLKTLAEVQIAILCIVVGLALNPVLGWVVAIFVENFRLIKEEGSENPNPSGIRITTLAVMFVSITSFILANI